MPSHSFTTTISRTPDGETEVGKAFEGFPEGHSGQGDLPPSPGHASASLIQGVFRVSSTDELQRLNPQDALQRWFRAGHPTRDAPPEVPVKPPTCVREPIGEVPDSSDIVHVVFRESPASVPDFPLKRVFRPRIRVITTRRTREGWMVMLNGGLLYEESGGWAIGWNAEDAVPNQTGPDPAA